MKPKDIEDLTIGLLAEEAKCSPAEMRQCLEEAGGDLPIDSILLVEVVAGAGRGALWGSSGHNFGEPGRFNLRSVKDFAADGLRPCSGRASPAGG